MVLCKKLFLQHLQKTNEQFVKRLKILTELNIMIKMKKNIKIFTAIFISILVTVLLSNYLFLNGTTSINQAGLANLVKNIQTLAKLPFNWLTRNNKKNELAHTPSLRPTLIPTINQDQSSSIAPSLIPTNTYLSPIPSLITPVNATPTIGQDAKITQIAHGVYSIQQGNVTFFRVNKSANAYYKEITLTNGTKVLFFNYE
ncbi:hypothetical protein A2313_02210 [Candidatus Roizmanbacteria bacterium RIFOXYB2_FULL_41_10]|uniref:Uncharacterized protein n=1 Tax=Candidatus Roizmanbacteria bacterium RIFOXYA1_FULL_41_12 TaxID=1802082 RepID=A0A1F7KAU6_9BACT|nr:MAG: hypothetical protein A2262_04290 [Candidatus Roizmanbacteria bacterium RIFOXYA2_FULL_41_8]OGK64967.1 MAG: hypothetical protein A2209_04730 [Candidatus Roizmanbacteria bacterium RIFOXYA1_FULL_41_12]OGK66769.1 MAG: hypothetical protein A2377_02590 [Candidatus Roizmanbacteria bacterium RIFOXYB1_FULL_41_27]OGK71897.1 MAG: hypothetical protein A2313_02210 [Candidatus Roizmanbacteria bacterium RIFOXYB2_FULL_41_10]OGK74376.1 MAG: hypothetical protein A2459_04075 [Candidatus Roizmanbacteria bac